DGDAASGRLVRRSIDLSNPWRSHRHLPVPLPGRHQALNAALAVTAADLLHHESLLRVPAAAVQSGLSAVRWPLRTEVLGNHPLVIVDAAHNEASIAALVETLSETSAGRRIVIFAASRDKDASAMLAQLRPAADVLILTRFLGNPRAISIEDLQRLCGDRHEGSLLTAEDPAAALQTALQLATQDDLICATGSFFLAAEVRTAWELVHGPAMP
ncbi:MAG: hypothetical protein KDA75_11560, partial [Planctomycetaceae bacterium]|nr:hypothetical protein [Planctomycetaceae bacterium]